MVGPTKKCLKLSHDLAMLTSSIIADGVAVSLLQTHYEQYRAEDGYKAQEGQQVWIMFSNWFVTFHDGNAKKEISR